jgi:hypothetical protein
MDVPDPVQAIACMWQRMLLQLAGLMEVTVLRLILCYDAIALHMRTRWGKWQCESNAV